MTQSSASEHKWFGPAHRNEMAATFVTKRVCSPSTYLTIKRCCSEQSVCRARVVRARGEAGVVLTVRQSGSLVYMRMAGGRRSSIHPSVLLHSA